MDYEECQCSVQLHTPCSVVVVGWMIQLMWSVRIRPQNLRTHHQGKVVARQVSQCLISLDHSHTHTSQPADALASPAPYDHTLSLRNSWMEYSDPDRATQERALHCTLVGDQGSHTMRAQGKAGKLEAILRRRGQQ